MSMTLTRSKSHKSAALTQDFRSQTNPCTSSLRSLCTVHMHLHEVTSFSRCSTPLPPNLNTGHSVVDREFIYKYIWSKYSKIPPNLDFCHIWLYGRIGRMENVPMDTSRFQFLHVEKLTFLEIVETVSDACLEFIICG